MSRFSQEEKRFYASSPAKYTANPKRQQRVEFVRPRVGEQIRVQEHVTTIRLGEHSIRSLGEFLVYQVTDYLVCCTNVKSAIMCKVCFSIEDFRVGIYSYEKVYATRDQVIIEELAE